MEPLLIVQLIVVLLLVLGNAFFVGAEIALTSARRSRIQQLADRGHGAARIVQQLHAQPERFYSVTQVGITLVSLGLGAVGIVTVTKFLQPALEFVMTRSGGVIPLGNAQHVADVTANVLAFLIISYLHIVGGELAPKVYAFHRPVHVSLLVARPVNVLYRTLAWAIWLLNASATALLWMFGQRQMDGPGGGHFSISEEELRTILAASEQEGVLKPHETKMIHGVIDLDEQTTHDLMVPRTQIVALPHTATISEALEVFRESKHSRYPVYLDTIDTIIGTLFIKELLESIDPRGGPASLERPITEIMRPPYIVPETKPVNLLLARFKSKRQQMAIVADEYGGTSGLVTLEDILEEIVGEFDDEASLQTKLIRRTTEDGSYYVDPAARLDDLGAQIGYEFEFASYNTVAGLIYHHLGRVAEAGDRIELPGLEVTVEAMDGHRLLEVCVKKVTQPTDGEATA